jgi:hypothetical protein
MRRQIIFLILDILFVLFKKIIYILSEVRHN